MLTSDQIASELTPHIQENNAAIGETNRRLAKIGDGQGNPRPVTLLTPRDVFYRSDLDQNDRGVAVLHPKCPIPLQGINGYYDTEVWIANVPGSSQVYIVDLADTGGFATGGPTPSEALTSTAAFPTQDRLVILRLRPSPDGGLSVLVDAGVYQIAYEKPGGGYDFLGTTTVDLSDPTNTVIFDPAGSALTSGQHCILGIAFDTSGGRFIAIQGTPVTASGALPSRSEFDASDYSAIDFTGFYPAGYAYSYYGQTTFVEDDCLRLFDPRLFISVMGSSLTVSDATPTATGVVEIEQSPASGHPKALTIVERNTPNGLSPVDTDGMRSSMELPLIVGQLPGAIAETVAWVRYGSNPLFGGSSASAAQEPSVFAEGGILRMWYTSGWASPQINLATSTDGLTWTQYGSNPVFNTNAPAHAFVVRFDGKYYMYYVNTATDDLYVTTSADGITWGSSTLIFAHNAFVWEVQWGNSYVWQEGYTWYAFFDYRVPGPGLWLMALATSADGITWTITTHTLSGIQPNSGVGMAAGGFMPYGSQRRNGLYHIWYQGTNINAELPTDIYHATSKDLINWTITNSGNPILTHTGSAPEVDQVADFSIVEFQGKTFAYFEGVDNATPASSIEVLTFNGRLSEVIDGVIQSNQIVQVNGSDQTQRGRLDLIAGTNVTLTAADDSANDRLKVTISSSGGSGGFLLVEDGVTAPPVALYTEDGTDFLYEG